MSWWKLPISETYYWFIWVHFYATYSQYFNGAAYDMRYTVYLKPYNIYLVYHLETRYVYVNIICIIVINRLYSLIYTFERRLRLQSEPCHISWSIRYGLYDMDHIIWSLCYGSYDVVYFLWTLLSYGTSWKQLWNAKHRMISDFLRKFLTIMVINFDHAIDECWDLS